MNPFDWLISLWRRLRNGPYVDSSPPGDDSRVPSDFGIPETRGMDDASRIQ